MPHFLSPAQSIARGEASTEMLQILHESEENYFQGIATGDESWFQCSDSCPSSKMFARSPEGVIPKTGQAVGTKKTMTTI
jgi:hypothetical protein